MKTFLVKEADLAGIETNALCTMDIGTKFNHHGLALDFTKAAGVMMTEAEIVADVDTISLTLKVRNGPSVRLLKDIPANVIFDLLNRYREQSKSSYTYAGILYVPFTRQELGVLVDPNALVIGMANIEHYTLQVQFKNVGLTTVKVGVLPEIDKGPARPLGEYVSFERWERSHATISVEHVTELPYGTPNTAMLGYHIDLGATGVCDDVEVRFDGEVLHDPLTIAQNNLLLHRAGRTPVSGYFHVDFNRKGSALPVGIAKSFRQKFNWSTAPNAYDVYTEMVYNLGARNYA
jgi:hypothetical protein